MKLKIKILKSLRKKQKNKYKFLKYKIKEEQKLFFFTQNIHKIIHNFFDDSFCWLI
jgi:hypothetical protein